MKKIYYISIIFVMNITHFSHGMEKQKRIISQYSQSQYSRTQQSREKIDETKIDKIKKTISKRNKNTTIQKPKKKRKKYCTTKKERRDMRKRRIDAKLQEQIQRRAHTIPSLQKSIQIQKRTEFEEKIALNEAQKSLTNKDLESWLGILL